jgi:parvulin-like peptidyl-prolyl isomerase
MVRRVLALFSLAVLGQAVIIDRTAIVVNGKIIKQSDIERDVRVTEFLNRESLNLGPAARKVAANRLIDQIFIRDEIAIGSYPRATLSDADKELDQIKSQRYRSNAAFEHALSSYGLTQIELRTEFQWQLTVLNFIELRFKPAAVVSDDEIQKYYDEHRVALERANPGKTTLDDLRQQIENTLSGEKVNQLFFSWLDEQRKQAKIQYLEEGFG